jgi:hypothetical protein
VHQKILSVIIGIVLLATQVALAGKGRASEVGRKFKLSAECQILTANGRELALADLAVGDRVSIQFRDLNGVLVADRITRGGKRKDGDTPIPATEESGKAHGAITALDAQAKTVTIDAKERQPKKK